MKYNTNDYVSPLVTISIIALTIDLTIFGYYYIKAKH